MDNENKNIQPISPQTEIEFLKMRLANKEDLIVSNRWIFGICITVITICLTALSLFAKFG